MTYEELLQDVLANGVYTLDRTRVGTFSVFGRRLRYSLQDGFPLITTKRVNFHAVVTELLWFLRGDTNIGWLHEHGVHIWDEWADGDGDLGPIYGAQWRDVNGFDQISEVLGTLQSDLHSRRMIISSWNIDDLPKMALPPCHVLAQFDATDGRLSCQVYQRSADMFLGVPFNIASYALLTHLMARHSGLLVGDLIWVGGNCHIYSNHLDQALIQIRNEPYPFGQVVIDRVDARRIEDYEPGDFRMLNYQCHPAIPAPIAI